MLPVRTDAWQLVEFVMPVVATDARRMQLQIWVAQSSWFKAPEEASPDPIVEEELDASVWVDDVAVQQLPHLKFGILGGSLVYVDRKPGQWIGIIEVEKIEEASIFFYHQ